MPRTIVSLLLAALPGLAAAAPQIDTELLGALRPRSIGPAGMSGRVAAVACRPDDRDVIYVGAATGGLWRTEDGGLSWTALFDDQPVASIGAVALHPLRSDHVWVGTGEGNPRNSSSVGNGVYRSRDGGRTWEHLGLERTEKIHRVLLHPQDPDVAWVAALGTTWGENEERGVFRTRDGGASWERVLYVDPRTGCADLAIDPSNPDRLYAAMWDHRRWPWFFRSGGPGSGLWITSDGGTSWERVGAGRGLPDGELGRIGLAVAPSRPRTVYALVEAEESALCRSDDGGASWRVVNDSVDVAQRPFYYADVRVDPADAERVYNLHSVVEVSDDGGRTFETLIPWDLVHPDHHALWIHPDDPSHLIDGNDGGLAISTNRGASWRFVRNLPLAQYYHVAVDDETPFNVYGGMQDNGSWRGPSAVWENGGVRNHHWQEVGFGDGFDTQPMPDDPLAGYAMSQGGWLMRWDLRTGERLQIRPDPPTIDGERVELRFAWNAGFALDPFDPATIYYGSQFVHRSRDRGASWERISPDLSTDEPEWQRQAESGGLTPDVTAAENHTTILSIAPSPVQPGVLWVGSDDGRLHVTRDGGQTWESLERNVLGVPEHTWIPHVEASRFDAATAFVVFDDHRRADWTPYVYRTTDWGRSWTHLATPELRGYVHVIEQDPVDPELLFVGTEFGLFVSLDGGRRWRAWRHGFPTVAVRDLVVHPRDGDLVIATHGRAAWVLDDVRPLRELSDEVAAEPLYVFEPPPAFDHAVRQTAEARFPGSEEFRGENRPHGALLTFWLRDETPEGPAADDAGEAPEAGHDHEDDEPDLEVEIHTPEGEVLRTLRPEPRRGLNRVAWDLAADGPRSVGSDPGDDPPPGPAVPPGTYHVRVRWGTWEAERALEVLPDPRREVAAEDRRARFERQREAGRLRDTLALAVDRVRAARADLEVVEALVERARSGESGPDAPHADLLEAADGLRETLDGLEQKLWTPPGRKGIVDRDHVEARVGRALGGLGSGRGAPTPAQLAHLAVARETLAQALREVDRAWNEDVSEFRATLEASGLRLFAPAEPLAPE